MSEQIELLDLAGVHRITTLSPSSILRLRKCADFPQPVQILAKNMFVKAEVVAWTEARAAARSGPGAVRRIVKIGVEGNVQHATR